MPVLRIAAAQTPQFNENLPDSLAHLLEVLWQAKASGARLLCFPEAFLQGYLTNSEAARRNAIDLSSPAFEAVLDSIPLDAPMLVVGLIEEADCNLHNTAAVIHRQRLVGRYRKQHLLSRERCFEPGDQVPTFEIDGLHFGINICSDCNFPAAAAAVAAQGASLLLCPANNMLPTATAADWRHKHNLVRGQRCRESSLWIMSADVTGSDDERSAWGPTAVLNPAGEVLAQLPLDKPGLLIFDVPT